MVYCRYPACSWSIEVTCGDYPVFCPSCGRRGRWSFVPKEASVLQPPAYDLTENDRQMLHRFGIARE